MLNDLLSKLEALGNEQARTGMARYGIKTERAYGIPVPVLRSIAKDHRRDHDLAVQLWATSMHEARALAAMVEDPKRVTPEQMEAWVADFDSWDICDGVCGLFAATPYAHTKAAEWSARPEEFVRRAGFALMATLAVHDKKAPDAAFEAFLPLIAAQAGDHRNFVRQAANWALRNIGKRNARLNAAAIACAEAIRAQDTPSARWIASDALRELRSAKVQARLSSKP